MCASSVVGGISEILKMLQTMFSDMESLVLPIVRLCVKFQRKKLTTSCYFGGPKCKSCGNTVGGGWGFVGLKFFCGMSPNMIFFASYG